ncbi:MAG: NADH-quinone oxidoreductase subunit N [Acidiphilium sp.]|nr:NADH-quinone oxidoreductase subunit N [Acidiphilium sp.]MDD4936574.1 NADH-quinone oxidoreductase subunit N [Acidiphilium sp.]
MIATIQPAAPLLILALTVTILLAAIAIKRSFAGSVAITALGLIAAVASIPWAMHGNSPFMASLFSFTPDSLGFAGLTLLAALVTLVLAADYLAPGIPVPREEYPLLLLLSTLGAVALITSASFITLFLGMETMSLAMIGMIAYPRFRPGAEEAGLKYLVLSGMSSAIVLFGIGLVELATGHLQLATAVATGTVSPILLAALALIGVGAGFKLAVVPFHIWVPDVYAGAPAPTAGFVAVIPKIAVLAVIVRVMAMPGATLSPATVTAISSVAILSMLIGNLLALMQENIKRIMGYSSIAHLGYVLVALLAASAIGRAGVVFYLVTYTITVIGAFAVIGVLSRAAAARDLDQVAEFQGLFWERPFLATIMTLVLLSLAGIPPAIGFIAKMYIMAAGVNADLRILTGTLVVSSIIGLFYYLRIILVMSQKPLERAAIPGGTLAIPMTGWLAMSAVGALIVGFGIDPESLIAMLKLVFG